MTVAALRAGVIAGLLDLAWAQWSQLGVSGVPPARREERAADPEALLLFTLHVGRHDPRLFDEVLGWLALNAPLVSTQRLRNLCADDTDRALVDAALDWTAGVRRRRAPNEEAPQASAGDDLIPVFPALAPLGGPLDPVFARHGLARPPLQASAKSQPPRLDEPISFAFRLRRLLGVGVRAEVIRTLLTIRAPRLASGVINASAGFAPRNVREGLVQLHEAGVIDVVRVSDDRYYSTRPAAWATLLGLPSAPSLPLHYEWIAAFRASTRILRWLEQPELDALSPYLLASRARSLVDAIEGDLGHVGIGPAVLQARRGADYWATFTAVVRATIDDVRDHDSG